MLEQVEGSLPSQPGIDRNTPTSPGAVFIQHVKNAHTAIDSSIWRSFLDGLSSSFEAVVKNLATAELDASDTSRSISNGDSLRAPTPTPTRVVEENQSVRDESTIQPLDRQTSPEPIEAHHQDDAVDSPQTDTTPDPDAAPLPLHRFTSMLHEYGIASNLLAPTFKQVWLDNGILRCVVSFNGVRTSGEAKKYKEAMHLASKKMCQRLQIA